MTILMMAFYAHKFFDFSSKMTKEFGVRDLRTVNSGVRPREFWFKSDETEESLTNLEYAFWQSISMLVFHGQQYH